MGKVDLAEGCGALNLVNVSEPLKVARLLLGVDDLSPKYVRIIPRLPPGWKGVEATNWPILTDRGIVRVHIRFERKGTGSELVLQVDQGQRIDDIKVRMPSRNGYLWQERKNVNHMRLVTH